MRLPAHWAYLLPIGRSSRSPSFQPQCRRPQRQDRKSAVSRSQSLILLGGHSSSTKRRCMEHPPGPRALRPSVDTAERKAVAEGQVPSNGLHPSRTAWERKVDQCLDALAWCRSIAREARVGVASRMWSAACEVSTALKSGTFETPSSGTASLAFVGVSGPSSRPHREP